MNALSLALLLALAGLGTPARNAGPAAAGTASGAASTSSLTDVQVDQRVRAYLGAIDQPVSADRWRALGPRAVTSLEAVVRDPQALPSRRGRALEALSLLGGARAKALLLESARSESEPFNVRASAMRGAARLFSARTLVKELRPVMQGAQDATVRAAAAEVLAEHAPSSACQAVAAQAARESPHRRAQFTRALESCSQGGSAP